MFNQSIKAAGLMALVCLSLISARNMTVLYVGNSLFGNWTSYQFCAMENMIWHEVMINLDSSITNISMFRAWVIVGRCDLPGQWKQGTGPNTARGQIAEPTGSPDGYYYIEQARGNEFYQSLNNKPYDYVVLEDDFLDPALIDSNYYYASLLADLCVSVGSKPVFFNSWANFFASYDFYVGYFDSLYQKYKDHGALLMPVYQAMELIHKDLGAAADTFLYADHHHANYRGGFLQNCLSYELFTRRSCVGYDMQRLSDWANCPAGAMAPFSNGEALYIEQKAHQAMLNFYGAEFFNATQTKSRNPVPVRVMAHTADLSRWKMFGLDGKAFDLPSSKQKSLSTGVSIASAPDRRMTRLLIKP